MIVPILLLFAVSTMATNTTNSTNLTIAGIVEVDRLVYSVAQSVELLVKQFKPSEPNQDGPIPTYILAFCIALSAGLKIYSAFEKHRCQRKPT